MWIVSLVFHISFHSVSDEWEGNLYRVSGSYQLLDDSKPSTVFHGQISLPTVCLCISIAIPIEPHPHGPVDVD